MAGNTATHSQSELKHRRMYVHTEGGSHHRFQTVRNAVHLNKRVRVWLRGCRTCIVSACVAPFRSGDTPLQHYNMVLTLATAQACADGILYFDNDDLLSRSKVRRRHAAAFGPSAAASTGSASAARASVRAERSGKGDELRISTGDMNDVAAQALAGVLLPVATRKRLPRGAREVRGRGEGEASGRPGWVDTRVSSNAAAAEAGAWALPEEEGKGGGRGSWIDASVRGIPAAYGGGGGGDDEDMEGYDEGLGSIVNSFDPRSFVQELVPAPARKFIDIRTVVNAFPDECGKGGGGVGAMHLPAGYHSYVSPALTWMELADNLSDVVPRFDKDGRPVVCTAARLYARGVTQTEADSVDPTLPGSSASGGGGSSIDPRARSTLSGRLPLGSSRSTAQLWQGLPSTEEWMVVGSKLQRMYPPLPGSTHLRSAVLSPPPLTRCSLSPLPVKPDLRMLTTAANTDWMVPNLISCVERTDELLHVGAYVHWYERFGVERGHIQAAAEAVLDAADAYMDARGGSSGGSGRGGRGGTQAPRR